jgi:hypothetical protein
MAEQFAPDPFRFSSFSVSELLCREGYFYCPTMNSHRPRSQNTSKEQPLIPEKESRRT